MRRIALVATALLVPVMAQLGAAGPAHAAGAPPYGLAKYAVIVGINHFEGNTRSNVGAVGDANAFQTMLENHGWAAGNILTLTDSGANQSAILNALQWLANQGTNNHGNAFLVFHYSGHVKQANGHEYLWPHDNKFIADSTVDSLLNSAPGWLWADFSGCESAGFDDGLSSPTHLVTTSSKVNEKSYEDPQWQQSVFSGLEITQAINQNEGDLNHDGHVSIQEAFVYADQQAPGMTAHQQYGPQHPYMAGGDGTEWVLDPPPPPPPPKPKQAPPPSGKPPLLCNKVCIKT